VGRKFCGKKRRKAETKIKKIENVFRYEKMPKPEIHIQLLSSRRANIRHVKITELGNYVFLHVNEEI